MIRVIVGVVVTTALCGLGPVEAKPPVTLWTVDGSGRVVRARDSRASLHRTPPTDTPVDPSRPHGDPDALRLLLAGDGERLPSTIHLDSLDEGERFVDGLRHLALVQIPCPVTLRAEACAVTAPIRAVADDIDKLHPLVRRRSVRARLGGAFAVRRADDDVVYAGRVRVTGPRRSALGPIDRYRSRLRFVFVRASPGGAPPAGGDDAGAAVLAERMRRQAGSLWGACGVSFEGEPLRIELVDPPPPHLLSVGCGHGLPASGGTLRFRAAGKRFAVPSSAGMRPAAVARRVATALRARGLSAVVFDNPRMGAGAGASSDVTVVDRRGRPVALEAEPGHPVSDDETMTACIGHVNLEDGLQHFSDVDATVGTLEERTLLRAVDDGDPRTIDVVLVPGFGRGGRIGESFIGADRSTLRNVVVVDRAGIQGGRASFTLAHELGHVLLDDPGHPDDFGRDTPSRLMDADAADPSAFGPRRLSIAECERALRQSGPRAPLPLLDPWPLSAP
ncbi:MAG: hypothetical protein AAF928_19190 [Myxococcota bacterium]